MGKEVRYEKLERRGEGEVEEEREVQEVGQV